VVEVEERGLSALEEDRLVGVECLVEHLDRVDHVRGESGAEFGELLHHTVDEQRLATEGGDLGVVVDALGTHRIGECGWVEHVARTEADASCLVGIGGSDALERRADLLVAATRLVQRIEALVPREDQVRLAADPELGAADAATFEGVDLAEQGGEVDDDPVPDDGDDVRIEHPARDQLQGVALAADDDGVTGVVPALIADDVAVLGGEQVDDLCLALVTPLGSNDNGDGHGTLLGRKGT